jgi:hypothetical protein
VWVRIKPIIEVGNLLYLFRELVFFKFTAEKRALFTSREAFLPVHLVETQLDLINESFNWLNYKKKE